MPCAVSTDTDKARISSGAPLTMSRRSPAFSASTETRRRSKSNGTSARYVQSARRTAPAAARMALSSGLRSFCSKPLLTAANSSTRALSAPSAPGWPASAIFACVSVPVLSVHSTVMAPRSWIDGEPLHHHLARGHAHGAARQRHRHDHRQQFRRHADGERHREQEGLDHRPVRDEMRQQHEQHHEAGEPQDQHAEGVQAALETAGRLGRLQRGGDGPEAGARAGRRDQHQRRAAHQSRAAEHAR